MYYDNIRTMCSFYSVTCCNTMPLVSIILPTYNRAHTLARAIDSVLNQSLFSWELIVVDDGSTDTTTRLLSEYSDSRIKVVVHPSNRGVTAALNTGLDNITGLWFAFLGSDDEYTPDAFQTMIEIAQKDPDIDAVTCNSREFSSGAMTGKGPQCDQYLDMKSFLRCSGEHAGITRTELIKDLRFDERLRGGEGLVWAKINANVRRRYYVNRALRVYHTELTDRICAKQKFNLERKIYSLLVSSLDGTYLDIVKKYHPRKYTVLLLKYVVALSLSEPSELSRAARNAIEARLSFLLRVLLFILRLLPFRIRRATFAFVLRTKHFIFR